MSNGMPHGQQHMGPQIGVGLGTNPSGQAFVVLNVNGVEHPIPPQQAQAVALALLANVVFAVAPVEQLRQIATARDTGIVAPKIVLG